LELVIEALNLKPSPAPMLEILLIASRFRELLPRVDSVCARYAADFEANKATYAGQDGYNFRLEAARLALYRMEQVAKAQGKKDLAQTYGRQWRQYESERDRISATKRW